MIERRKSQVSSHHFKTLSLLNLVVCGSDDRVFRSSEPSLLIYPWEKFPWHSTWQSTWQLWQWQWCPDIDCANPWHVLTHRSEEEEDYKNIRFYILIYFIEQSIMVRFLMYLKNTLFLQVRIALILFSTYEVCFLFCGDGIHLTKCAWLLREVDSQQYSQT